MRSFTVNLRTFLLALLLAIAVWISAVTSADPDEVRILNAIPLEAIGQDPAQIVTSNIPTSVDVTLRAPHSVWERLSAQENSVQAVLDLSGLGSGEYTLDVKIQIPEEIRPVRISLINPTTVTVILEPLATRTLSLDLSLRGEPAIGYQAGDATLEPKTVTISGPKSIIQQVQRARIPVNLAGARESIDQSIGVQIVDGKNNPVNGIVVSPESVHVTIPISQQGGFRDVAVKVVVEGQVASGYRLENISVLPPVVTVYSADPEAVNALPGVVDTQPLNLQDAKENITTRLALNLPENVTVVGAQTVQVSVVISPIQTSITLLNQQINIIGLSEGTTVEIAPQTIDVIISGPLPALDALTPQDVIITIDVTGLAPGTFQLTPKVEVLIDGVLVESILPGTVEVTITIAPTPTPAPTPTAKP
jgi:YbbR domain-containing protein